MTTSPVNAGPMVEVLLERSGLRLQPEEVAELAANYEDLRAALDKMHSVTDVRYEAPALVFNPARQASAWGA